MSLTSAVPERSLRRMAMLLVAVLSLGVLMAVAPTSDARAAELPSSITDGGYIISDREFFNGGAMTAAQAQSFLEARVPSCKATTGPNCLRGFKADLPAKAKDAYCDAIAAKKGARASEIIVAVGKACGISPKVILVMLQKEQGLVTSTKPTDWSYRASMGMNCPDTAPCSAASAGFINQVYLGARQQQVYAKNPTRYGYRAGQVNTVKWHPDSACGTSKVFIKNQATANLYIYTPYRPNIAALAAGYAQGDGCSSYGNRNFYNYYVQWFAPEVSPHDSGAAARVDACTVPVDADIAAGSGTATLTVASTARRAPVATCATGAQNVAKGATFTVTGTYGSWVRVVSGSNRLWLPKTSVKVTSGTPAAGACAVPAESSVEKATGTVVVTADSLNARKAPSTSCETDRRSLTKGQMFERTAIYGVWWRLRVGGADYWAHSDYLNVQSVAVKAFSRGPLHVRSSAGGSGLVRTLATGDEVTVLQVEGSWSQVQAGSSSGWVESRMLASSKPSLPVTSVMQTSGSVVLRSVMADGGAAVRTLASGTKVTVVDSSGSWRAVTEGSSAGWVPASSLVKPAVVTTKTTTAALNLRAEPSTSGRLITTLPKDTRVSVLEVQGTWSQVTAGSSIGWVSGEYLR
ncbi:SH3 domain-containing protein [Microbacterium sp. LKL04]|uniref:SH3 domain-containing protein n=1 Tax=Microbacterium sp. LKL04 TaxID=912630 RepID=UPI000B85C50B|nr:SH3 domain-containing protein [Microbacterium sp. LKL04]